MQPDYYHQHRQRFSIHVLQYYHDYEPVILLCLGETCDTQPTKT